MRILAAVQGEYGQRIVDNVRQRGPEDWELQSWTAPRSLPIIVDDPEDFLPVAPQKADLILSLVESRSASDLIPDLAELAGAQAVIAPVDNRTWLPQGMMRQMGHRLASKSISSTFPVPFCSLEVRPEQHPLIQEFATHFGRPKLAIETKDARITGVRVLRGAPCGGTHLVAQRLIGVAIGDAEEQAGLAHHHHPCLASMVVDDEFEDTLMHQSGLMTKTAVHGPLRVLLREQTAYVRPD